MTFKTQLYPSGFGRTCADVRGSFGRIERLAPHALRLAAAFNDIALASACGSSPFIALAVTLGIRMFETKKAQAVGLDQDSTAQSSHMAGPAFHL